MNIILQGPQGSGKGTQAELLVKKYNLHYFEAGKILRSIAASDNKYAPNIRAALDSGNLVPDEYVRLIAWDYITKHSGSQGYLFDGYPRSLLQYEYLQDMLRKLGQKLDAVININISESESILRLGKRRTCTKCSHIQTGGDVCEECGEATMQRPDDQPAAIKRRLQIYHQQTHPVFERAVQEGIGFEINGEQSIEKVNQDIVACIS